jgi:hypothetical protein
VDNAWFGIAIIATLAAAGWYTGQATTRPYQRLVSYVLASIGVLIVAFALWTVMR